MDNANRTYTMCPFEWSRSTRGSTRVVRNGASYIWHHETRSESNQRKERPHGARK